MPRGIRKNNPEAVAKAEAEKAKQASLEANIRADERAKLVAEMNASNAANHPSIKTPVVMSSEDAQVGQRQFHEIPATGSVSAEDFKDTFQVVDGPAIGDKAAELAFMEEKVTIRLATTADKTAEPIPCFGVNGVNQYIVRGKPQVIKRKFLQEIARAKIESINTPFGRDANGFDTYNIGKQQSLKYPFELIEDKNPRGRPWLEKILAEA